MTNLILTYKGYSVTVKENKEVLFDEKEFCYDNGEVFAVAPTVEALEKRFQNEVEELILLDIWFFPEEEEATEEAATAEEATEEVLINDKKVYLKESQLFALPFAELIQVESKRYFTPKFYKNKIDKIVSKKTNPKAYIEILEKLALKDHTCITKNKINEIQLNY